ncbi:dATP/dGTP pyrophosphohydrolase domain-containing protein [Klebsiella aerogenes]|uniref:dATP/dGTP pyrophosphohydrolase domain-containing protein n=1 Tax=Klebsiella aerogenes TaxID=548 RepID=UPI0013D8AD83|nr:dATP/dGTP pyrophosphohydrolase domain-containing protein [Klebsiella aerogenes]
MTKSTITDERITSVIERLEHFASNLKWTDVRGAQDLLTAADGLRELQERRKVDSEPAIIVGDDGGDALAYRRLIQSFSPGTKLYRHAQPSPERDQVRNEHAEWSQTTFGNVGPIGPLKHLSKEALEAAAEPGDLSEWADMQFLLWDAQRRAGITDEQITQAMIEKLAVNKQREWPEPKDGEPRLHIKAQPAPVVVDDEKLRALFDAWFASDCSFDQSPEASEADNIAWRESYWYVWQRCRAAMLQAEPVTTANKLENYPAQSPIDHGYRPGCECSCCKNTVRICAELAGWIPVSERMPENDVSVLTFDGMYKRVHHAMYGHWQCWEPGRITHWMPLPASPQEVKP